ncbi:MAG: hypothetical protein WDN03_08950 [Rhizomicrobium sp.]
MDPLAGKIVVNGAPSQLDRWLDALAPGYARVDGRDFAALLGFPAAFGRLVNFFDLDDRIDGDWRDFFLYDPTLALARVASADLGVLAAGYHDLVAKTRAAGRFDDKFALLTQVFAATAAPAHDLDACLRALNAELRGDAVLALRQRIAALITDELGAELHRLSDYAKGAGERSALGRAVPFDSADFLPIWNIGEGCADASIYKGASPQRRIDSALGPLQDIFDAFSGALGGLQATARADLAASLESGDHKPHVALFIAFAKLFGTAQDTINAMAERYAAFYYHDLLREDFRGPTPDSVYLAFTLADDDAVTSTSVPSGTLFPAGKDADGNDILYGAPKGLTVTAAQLADLRTLRVERSPLLPGDATEVEQQIFTSLVSTKPAADAATSWTTFGATPATQGGSETTALAILGFAVASPYLLLAGGTRTVSLRLTYTQDPAGALDARLAALARATGLDAPTIFAQVLSACFSLSLSTAAGWLEIESYRVAMPKDAGTCFDIRFTLQASAAPIAPLDPDAAAKAPGANPSPQQPTLRLYLKQDAVAVGPLKVYPLSLLAPLLVSSWAIAVDVSGFAVAALGNTDGDIDPTKPFPALGGAPVIGSFLDIRAPELFAKTLTTLEIALTWFSLPQNEDGFFGWYRDYTIGMDGLPSPVTLFDNTTFRAAIAVRNPGTWALAPLTGPENELFRTSAPVPGPPGLFGGITGQPAGPLYPATVFDTLEVTANTRPPYYDPAASSLRLTLIEPPYGFGDQLYPINVLACVIADIPPPPTTTAVTTGDTTVITPDPPAASTVKYPNPPWLPQAGAVTLRYTARWTSDDAAAAADGTYFHLLPFGGTQVAASTWLLTHYPNPGNLYIGLAGLLTPQVQTILFQMGGGGAGWSEDEPPLRWEILSGNDWIALTAPQILSDGTNNLQNSGIVTLSLPATDAAPGTVMPSGSGWLHAAADDPAQHPRGNGVFPNALLARCQTLDGTDRFAGPLPAGTIASSVQDLPAVQTILQPAPSFGGRPAQIGKDFHAWLGERLRHKNRAVQAWDFERLVLEAFPSIWKVQALPARKLPTAQSQGGDSPGDVLIVVVPGSSSAATLDPTAPMASPDTLAQVSTYLETVASPFVTLYVANPQYVRVAVNAKVQFAADADSGATVARLNDELVQYLSPWFYDAARAAKQGNYAGDDEIAEFIETRPYVDALVSLDLSYSPRREALDWYFLTSATSHAITPTDEGPCTELRRLPAPAAAR